MLNRDFGLNRDAGSVRSAFRPAGVLRGTLLTLCIATVMAACTPTVKQHGHRIDDEMLASLVPGRTSKEEVLRLIGSPSSIGTFEDNHWYYVSQVTERVSFYQSEIAEQDVITVAFDDRGIVSGIHKQGLEQAQDVVPTGETTRTLGKELSLFEQLIGNIGRFSDRDGPVGGN
ncbi:MAG: outer membrane protein assembly factor BamE [Geminicoccaceae bacterium]|nr:outer membrane protein assembly factor BamE [Geminicoccaceae bacterium]MCB2010449.1 outer membrane protein assembly factor BamE [Geminicoccaceae bacterium]